MIDLSEIVAQARQKGDHRNGTRFLAEFHGGGCNEFSVYAEAEKVELMRVGKSSGGVRVAQTPNGIWLGARYYDYAIGGASSPVSVWSCQGFESREEAIAFVKLEVAEAFSYMAERQNNGLTETMKAEAKKMSAALSSILPVPVKAKQLTLF